MCCLEIQNNVIKRNQNVRITDIHIYELSILESKIKGQNKTQDPLFLPLPTKIDRTFIQPKAPELHPLGVWGLFFCYTLKEKKEEDLHGQLVVSRYMCSINKSITYN